MFPRLGYTICLMFLLTLSGCFQQASESLEPANSTVEPLSVPESLDEVQAESEITALPSTPTFPPITIISQPTVSNIGQLTSEPEDKPEETLDAMAASGGQTDLSTPPLFITPGLPDGPVSISTPGATSPGGATTATPSGLITPTDLFAGRDTECTYIVASGDNLYRIAVTNNTTVEAMKQANPDLVGEAPILQPGQVLNLPDCESSVTPADNISDQGITDSSVSQPVAPSAPSTSGQTYTVKAGDTLFSIATALGTTVQAIVDANNLTNPDALQVGQQLIIP